jgi:molybdopterin-guanine dinucleotide biosynthesis protein A
MVISNNDFHDEHDNTFVNVLGIVLAGGQSSRMKVDKSTLRVNNVSNLERAINLLTSCGINEVVVSGNALGQIPDIYQKGGPLSGIFSVITSKMPTAVLVIPIDMPLLDTQTLNALLTQGQLTQDVTQTSACCFEQHSLPIYLPVTELLISFLSREFLSERYTLYNKGPSFKHLLKHIGCLYIVQPHSSILSNVNTQQQWQDIKHLIN